MKNTRMLIVWACLTFALGRTEGQTVTATTETNAIGVSSSTEPTRSSSLTATTAQPGSSTRGTDATSSQNTATGTSPQQSSGSAPSSTSARPGSNTATAIATTSKAERVASLRVYGQILIPAITLIYSAQAPF